MKKLLLLLAVLCACGFASPTSAATTVKAPAKAKTTVVKKTVTKKVTTANKYGSAKNPVFSPQAAAVAMGNVPGGAAYQDALRAAQKKCIAAGSNKEKLAACDQAFKDAQALLGQ